MTRTQDLDDADAYLRRLDQIELAGAHQFGLMPGPEHEILIVAGASIDLEHDGADLDTRITCPLRILWAEKGAMGRLYDVMAIWRERGTQVTGRALPGGHNLQEDVPEMVLDEIRTLLKA